MSRLLLQKVRELLELVLEETLVTDEMDDLVVEIEELIQEEEMYG